MLPENEAEPVTDGVEAVGLFAALHRFVTSVAATAPKSASTAVMLMFLTPLAEGFGVALILPALQLTGFNSSDSGIVGHYVAGVLSFLASHGLPSRASLGVIIGCLGVILVLRAALLRLQLVYVMRAVYEFTSRIDISLYQAIVKAKWEVVARRRSSELMHLLTNEHERLTVASHDLLLAVSQILAVFLYGVLAFLLAARVTLGLLILGALLTLLLRRRSRDVHVAAIQASVEMKGLYGEALEHLQNLKAVKVFGAQERDVAMFERLINRASDVFVRSQKLAANSGFLFEGSAVALLLTVLYLAIRFQLSTPINVILLLAVFSRIMPKVSVLYSTGQSLIVNLPAHTRVELAIEEFARSREAVDLENPALPLDDRISFDRVCFQFHGVNKRAVDAVSLEIPARKITALVGPSGAGKSTVADLLMGLLVPQSGQIKVDSTLLTNHSVGAWRSGIGYVGQDSFLFHNTVRENLLWGNPQASEEEIYESLRLSSADFVLHLPDGIDTVIGERGQSLSQGERQRIALARALLRSRVLLILDEATNSLDAENEARIISSLSRLKDRLTVVVIAHRLSSVRSADLIHVLDHGRMVESGTWQDLVGAENGRFKALHDAQMRLSAAEG